MSARVSRSYFQLLIAVASLLACAATVAIGLTVWRLRSDALRDASNYTGNLATVLAEQTDRSVQSIDIVLDGIRKQLEQQAVAAPNGFQTLLHSKNINELLKEQLSQLSQSERMFLVDKNGFSVNTTVLYPSPKLDASDRDYYRHFKNNDDKHVFISQVHADRRTGKPFIVFGRRIDGPRGEFLGIVLTTVKFSYFESIYRSVASLRGRIFLLSDRDGTVIVRYPGSKTRAGEKIPAASPWYHLVAQGGGYLRVKSAFDGVARLIAVRPLRQYPLVVNVALSEATALASWRNQATIIGFGTSLVDIILGLLLRALSKQFHRLSASEATLERANTTVDAALNNMSQGLVMFDSSNRLVVRNQRYLEMYRLSPQTVRPGCSLRDLLTHRAAAGDLFTDDPEQYMAEILSAIEQGATFTKLTGLTDGRIISIVNRPMENGGWVATHDDVTDSKRAEEQISYAALHDALTSLPNRRLFSEQLEHALKRARRGEPLAVLYLDVDHLKRINDTLGHFMGDKLLKGIAERVRRSVRDIDMVARLGADEFAIIQTSLEHPSDAADLAVRVREAIHKPFEFDGRSVTIDISVGISIAPNDATELEELLKTADIALYEAKNSGRGSYCFYEPEMNARMQARDKIERDLRSALVNDEFELFYQPVVDIKKNKIMSCEALLRWRHPTRGLIAPTEFIPIAEEIGLVIPLGEWVLRTACAEAANWPEEVGVAVNVSAAQLKKKGLATVVMDAIASSGLRPDRLILEITETVFLQNMSTNLDTLKHLHEFGVRLSMDDFGTGYSSLSYLLFFPFSKIKIDRSFITGLVDKKESRAIVRAITDLARSLEMRVIAEGVETTQQLAQLRRLGCLEIQGYLFSPPRPAEEIRQLLASSSENVGGFLSVANRVA